MAWLKKNLFLAVGGLILLGLLGFAIFFLINSKAVVDEVTGQLAEQTEQLKKLAAVVKLSPEEFRKRFEYLVK